MKKSLKIAGIILAIILVLVVIGGCFAPELTVLYIKYIKLPEETNSDLYSIPETKYIRPVAEHSNSDLITFKDMNFELPWGLPLEQKELKMEGTLYRFKNDKHIIVFKNGGTFGAFAYGLKSAHRKEIINLIGTSRISYTTIKPILEVTPNNIKFFTHREVITKQVGQLLFKSIMIPKCKKMYHLITPKLEVIEYWDYSTKKTGALLDITDNKENFYEIAIIDPNLTQAKVEKIMSSIRINNE